MYSNTGPTTSSVAVHLNLLGPINVLSRSSQTGPNVSFGLHVEFKSTYKIKRSKVGTALIAVPSPVPLGDGHHKK